MVSFAIQMLVSLVRSHLVVLFLFAFISFVLGDQPRKILCTILCQRMFCQCSFLRVLWCHKTAFYGVYTNKPLSHFEFFFFFFFSFSLYVVCECVLTSLICEQDFPSTAC